MPSGTKWATLVYQDFGIADRRARKSPLTCVGGGDGSRGGDPQLDLKAAAGIGNHGHAWPWDLVVAPCK